MLLSCCVGQGHDSMSKSYLARRYRLDTCTAKIQIVVDQNLYYLLKSFAVASKVLSKASEMRQ